MYSGSAPKNGAHFMIRTHHTSLYLSVQVGIIENLNGNRRGAPPQAQIRWAFWIYQLDSWDNRENVTILQEMPLRFGEPNPPEKKPRNHKSQFMILQGDRFL